MNSFSTRLWLVTLLVTARTLAVGGARTLKAECGVTEGATPLYTYQIVSEYPHDPTAFTEGLVYEKTCSANGTSCQDTFFESTGMFGKSDVRRVTMATGAVQRRGKMPSKWFGEGLVKRGSRLYQLTWLGPQGFIYSAISMKRVGKFKTPLKDGWGAATDGGLVVVSDGSDTLTWLDPDNGFSRVRSVKVRDGGRPVKQINELEVVYGEVWANVWMTECIARICPETGRVTGWVLTHGMAGALRAQNLPQQGTQMDVLNGIAWDAEGRRLFVTGKYWPRLYEIRTNLTTATPQNLQALETCFV